MPFRRLWAGLPLAVFVAVLAHIAGFGFSHLPGGEHAAGLFGMLVAGLTALLGSVFVRATIARAPRPFATGHDRTKSALALAGVAAGVFAAIEVSEGRDVFGGGLWALLALLPIAVVAAIAARRVDRFAQHAGTCVANYLRRSRIRVAVAFISRTRARLRSFGVLIRRVARGRAPPRFA